jgi:hypothetical protein
MNGYYTRSGYMTMKTKLIIDVVLLLVSTGYFAGCHNDANNDSEPYAVVDKDAARHADNVLPSEDTDSGKIALDATDADSGDSAQRDLRGSDAGCTDFPDESGTVVEIVVKNERTATIYVGSREPLCNVKNELLVRDSTGADVAIETASCYTCAELVTKGACVYSCGPSPLYKLSPGATLTLHWNGTYFVTHELSLPCQKEWGRSCPQERAAPAGKYTVTVTASSAWSCRSFDDCSCIETDTCPGASLAHGSYGNGDAYQSSVEIRVPDQTSATVIFRN